MASLTTYKTGICQICDDDTHKPLISGKCKFHYWNSKSKKKAKEKPSKVEKSSLYECGVSELIKLAVIVFNKFIRERDIRGSQSFICISCNRPKHISKAQCGHYMPSTYTSLKFNEDNCHAECVDCNCNDDNHLKGYRANLIVKIGLDKVLWLESHKIGNTVKWDKSELIEIINKYKT
jgi:hypothetical protein